MTTYNTEGMLKILQRGPNRQGVNYVQFSTAGASKSLKTDVKIPIDATSCIITVDAPTLGTTVACRILELPGSTVSTSTSGSTLTAPAATTSAIGMPLYHNDTYELSGPAAMDVCTFYLASNVTLNITYYK